MVYYCIFWCRFTRLIHHFMSILRHLAQEGQRLENDSRLNRLIKIEFGWSLIPQSMLGLRCWRSMREVYH